MRRPSLRVLTLLAFIVTLGSCDKNPTNSEPTPGTLKLVLLSPTGTEAGILVQLDGVGISDVVVSGEERTSFVRDISATRIKVAILGEIGSGELLRFNVPDTKKRSSYVATVLQVAGTDNELRESPTTYQLQIQR